MAARELMNGRVGYLSLVFKPANGEAFRVLKDDEGVDLTRVVKMDADEEEGLGGERPTGREPLSELVEAAVRKALQPTDNGARIDAAIGASMAVDASNLAALNDQIAQLRARATRIGLPFDEQDYPELGLARQRLQRDAGAVEAGIAAGGKVAPATAQNEAKLLADAEQAAAKIERPDAESSGRVWMRGYFEVRSDGERRWVNGYWINPRSPGPSVTAPPL